MVVGSGFGNIFKIPELKKRILYTLALLFVYRIGVHVPTPGIDTVALASFFAQMEGTIFGIFNMFSGGALEQLSVFALGIMPYISSSIILQLLTVVWPYLEKLSKEGEAGRNGGPPGDLYVEIRLEPHKIFVRDGADLSCEVPISFATAALGGEVELPTLDGNVSLKVPASPPSPLAPLSDVTKIRVLSSSPMRSSASTTRPICASQYSSWAAKTSICRA